MEVLFVVGVMAGMVGGLLGFLYGIPFQRWEFSHRGRQITVRNYALRETISVDGVIVADTRRDGFLRIIADQRFRPGAGDQDGNAQLAERRRFSPTLIEIERRIRPGDGRRPKMISRLLRQHLLVHLPAPFVMREDVGFEAIVL